MLILARGVSLVLRGVLVSSGFDHFLRLSVHGKSIDYDLGIEHKLTLDGEVLFDKHTVLPIKTDQKYQVVRTKEKPQVKDPHAPISYPLYPVPGTMPDRPKPIPEQKPDGLHYGYLVFHPEEDGYLGIMGSEKKNFDADHYPVSASDHDHSSEKTKADATKSKDENSKTYPLLLYLHGVGESGDINDPEGVLQIGQTGTIPSIMAKQCDILEDNQTYTYDARDIPGVLGMVPIRTTKVDVKLVNGDQSRTLREYEGICEIKKSIYQTLREQFIIVIPRTNNQGWDGKEVVEFTQYLLGNRGKLGSLKIDPTRIHITGVSMGGKGVWEAASLSRFLTEKTKSPLIYASAIPICAAGTPDYNIFPAETNVWAFHGRNDVVVPHELTQESIGRLRKKRGLVGEQPWEMRYKSEKWSPAPAGWEDLAGHASWVTAYRDNMMLYNWILENKIGGKRNLPGTHGKPNPERNKGNPASGAMPNFGKLKEKMQQQENRQRKLDIQQPTEKKLPFDDNDNNTEAIIKASSSSKDELEDEGTLQKGHWKGKNRGILDSSNNEKSETGNSQTDDIVVLDILAKTKKDQQDIILGEKRLVEEKKERKEKRKKEEGTTRDITTRNPNPNSHAELVDIVSSERPEDPPEDPQNQLTAREIEQMDL